MPVKLEAFLDLEDSLTTRLHRSYQKVLREFVNQFTGALKGRRFADAADLIDGLDMTPVAEDNAKYIRSMGSASMLHGAARVAGEPEDARLNEEFPSEQAENASELLQTMIKRLAEPIRQDARKLLKAYQGAAAETSMETVMKKAVGSPDVLIQKALTPDQIMAEVKDKLEEPFVLSNILGIKDKYATPRARDIQFPLWQKGQKQLQIYSSLHISRNNTFGFLAEASMRGISTYQVNEVMDDRICAVCQTMHGKTFEVSAAMERAMQIMNMGDPDDIKQLAPWPSQSKAAVAELREMTDAQLQSMNLDMPPYHPLCRGVIDYISTEVIEDRDVPTIGQMTQPFRTFPNEKKFNVWAERAQGKFLAGLPDDQLKAMDRYKGNMYHPINDLARGNMKKVTALNANYMDDVITEMSKMDDVFGNAGAQIPDSIVVHRGSGNLSRLGLKGVPKKLGMYLDDMDNVDDMVRGLVGQKVTDKGFVSATGNKVRAGAFREGGHMPYHMEIRLPKGSRAVWADRKRVVGGQINATEAEMIIDRGTAFKIVGAEIRTSSQGGRYVHMVMEAQQPAQRLKLSDPVLKLIKERRSIAGTGNKQRLNLWAMSKEEARNADILFRTAQKGRNVDEIYSLAAKAQAQFEVVGKEVVEAVGGHTKFMPPPKGFGIKKPSKSLPKLVEKYGGRTEDLTDISRGGFFVKNAKEADSLVANLLRKYDVLDEGWVTNPAGYFDRKLLLRNEDGFLTEVQMWTRGIWRAKEKRYNIFGRPGHALYDDWIKADRAGNVKLADELSTKMRELYASVTVDPSLEVFRVYGSQANWLKAGMPELPKVKTLPKRVTGSAPYKLRPMPTQTTTMLGDDLVNYNWRSVADRKVLKYGRDNIDGTEYAMIFDAKSGKLILEKAGEPGARSVNFTLDEVKKLRASKNTVLVHNHPSGRPLSDADIYFGTLIRGESIAVSQTEAGVSYQARAILKIDDLHKSYVKKIKKLHTDNGVFDWLDDRVTVMALKDANAAANDSIRWHLQALVNKGLNGESASYIDSFMRMDVLHRAGIIKHTIHGKARWRETYKGVFNTRSAEKYDDVVDKIARDVIDEMEKKKILATRQFDSMYERRIRREVVEQADDFTTPTAWAKKFDDADVTPDKIYAEFPDEVRLRMQAEAERIAAGATTKAQYYDDVAKAWSADRVKNVHDVIVKQVLTKDIMRKAAAATGETPQYIVLGGRPASGKSFFAKPKSKGGRGLNDSDNFLVFNPDDVKELMKPFGYEGWNAALYHEEAQAIAERIIATARAKRMNIMFEGTLSNKAKAIKNAEIFKKAGYDQIGMFMHTPRQVTAMRTVERYLGPEGRYVPIEVVLKNKANEINFDLLKDKYFKMWEFYDNQGSGSPILLGKGMVE